MNNKDVSIRELEGPYKCHLYIGFAPANWKIVLNLCKRLQNQGVICSHRSLNESIKESIQEGVNTSQKCLLFLTSDYVKDHWYQIETQAVIEKSERFCRDVVVILKSGDLEVFPERLREFTTEQYQPEKLSDEKFLAHFVDLVTRKPNVQLAVLPKQNIGFASAYGYFYGFLRLVLPDFKKRLIEETLKYDPDLVPKTVQKMLIIMPESCFCAEKLQSPNKIEFTGKFVVRVGHRAGNHNRDYKSSLYKLIDHEKDEEYYFVGELATPLLTMYETYFFGLCGMTKDQLYAERDAFYFILGAILSHPDNAECNDQFKLLYWSDPETKKPNQPDFYNFLLPELRKEITLQQQNQMNPPKIGASYNVDLLSSNPLSLKSFEPVTVDGSNPARIYEELSRYPMDSRVRGLCLIVNIAHFDKGHRHLLPRRGAEKDAELLTKLFEDLRFNVQVHKDVNAQTLESLFLTMHIADHTNYNAFVCCILTHGKLGVIYTSDGKPIEILKLVDFFTDRNCPSLKGKPKMFFIQACQKGDPEPENCAAGNSLPHNGSTGSHFARSSSQNMASDSTSSIANRETVEEVIRMGIYSIQEEISSNSTANIVCRETVKKEAQEGIYSIHEGISNNSTAPCAKRETAEEMVQEEIYSLQEEISNNSTENIAKRETVVNGFQEEICSIQEEISNNSIANIAKRETEGISSIQEGSSSIAVTDVQRAIEEDATSAPTVSMLDETSSTTLVHKAVLVPGSPDFLMSYSTLPGSISYRDTHTGSLYIQSLNDCLRKDMEIDRALKMVSSSVKEKLRQRGELDGGPERFQLPFHLTSGMDRLIYL